MSVEKVSFRVHLPRLLKEIAECSQQQVLRIPLNITQSILARVAERATQLNDPELNALMCKLALYSVADPGSEDYDPELVEKLLKEHNLG